MYPLAKIVKPQMIEIGDYSMIDELTFINGSTTVKNGKYVHFAYFVNIISGGELIIGDYALIGH